MARRARTRVTLGLALAAALTGVAILAGGDDPGSQVGAKAWAVGSISPRSLSVPEAAAAAIPPSSSASPAARAVTPAPAPAPVAPDQLDLSRIERRGDRFVAPMGDGRLAVLTLDPTLQAAAERALASALAPRGAIVVTAPDGRVLALAGRRTESPDGGKDGIDDPTLALTTWAPAASVFKIVTSAALLEQGVRPSTRVCYHGGVRSVMESNLEDSRQDRACQDLAFGVAHSQNAILAKLAHQHLMPDQLAGAAHRLGFDRPLTFPAPATFGQVDVPAERGLELARTAAGFRGVELSTLGGAMLASTVASGGLGVQPRLIAAFIGPDGSEHPVPAPAAPTRVLDASVAGDLASMMEKTCSEGSAAAAFGGRRGIPDVQVAGKTGTLSRDEAPYMQYSWFVGFAPAEKPQLNVAVLLGNAELWHLKAHTAARMVLAEGLRTRAGS
ncbi:MAG TPA: penicillin-binding transpeptidase domain-containing protein [Kofleriaceae bacterium]|nr:penicillin-binding transpeptidase domain-containing protein [Kofleriaceae bacterium]